MFEETITPAGLNRRQAAVFLGVSVMTVRRMTSRGELRPARFGRRVVYPRVELERRLHAQSA